MYMSHIFISTNKNTHTHTLIYMCYYVKKKKEKKTLFYWITYFYPTRNQKNKKYVHENLLKFEIVESHYSCEWIMNL